MPLGSSELKQQRGQAKIYGMEIELTFSWLTPAPSSGEALHLAMCCRTEV
jgi:hypothetical protein